MRDILEKQRAAFRAKFGREPEPQDPIFFNPDVERPEFLDLDVLHHTMVEAMSKADIPPELIYAFQKTGRIVSHQNQKFLSEDEIKEWNDAIAEYFERERKQRI